MDSTNRPSSLIVAALLIFGNGLVACVAMFTGKGIDILAIGSLLVVYGILTRKSWASVVLQIIAGFHILTAVIIALSFILPFNGTGQAQISFHQMQWEVSPIIVLIIFVLVALFYTYVAFNKDSKEYFART